VSDPNKPGPEDRPDEPATEALPGSSLWDQVPDAEPWSPEQDRRAPWADEPTRSVPPVSEPSGPPSSSSSSSASPPSGPSGAGVMENFVGSRIERVREAAASAGWALSTKPVDPEGRNQPDGMVVTQAPRPGTPMGAGSAVAVSVVSRRSLAERAPGALVALAAVAALVVGALAGWALAEALTEDPEPELVQDPEAQAQIEQLSAANQELTGQVDGLQQQNEQLNAQVEELAATNAELVDQVEELTAQRDQAVEELAAAQDLIANLEDSLNAIDDTFTVTENLVGTQVTAAQDYAENRQLELIVAETSTLPPGTPAAAPGTVLEQAPQPGVPVPAGSVLWVQVYVEDDNGD
jgi:cell division protein FtsB